ncbi:MAG TPA: type II CAAX endopeptidase family protein [Candidatus Binatia bacterium]|nr:type II CAAX endopeptidase family protein [Candidatus Binatia bacterium]
MSRFTDNAGKLRPIWAFVFSFILSGLAFLVSSNIAHEISPEHPFRVELIFRPLWVLLLLGIFIWLLTVGDHIEEHRIAAQGLPRTKGWFRQFLLGWVLGFVLTFLAVVPIHFWGRFRTHDLMTLRLLPNLAVLLFTLLCGALAEELVFRGYPFQHLEQGIGTPWTVLLTSVLYAVLHLLNPGSGRWAVANSFLLGVLFCIAYLRTRALWLPWGIHFAWNGTLALLFGLPVSGFRSYNLTRYTEAYGPKWLTGGRYGVEASAAGTVVILVAILVLWKLPLRKLPQPTPPRTEPALHDSLSGIQS